ncbi:hypothetical protein GCM10007905_29580 [Mixta theicola]|nr:hypothetical protein GCM10007905_29580 [Mixta theicola]
MKPDSIHSVTWLNYFRYYGQLFIGHFHRDEINRLNYRAVAIDKIAHDYACRLPQTEKVMFGRYRLVMAIWKFSIECPTA